MARAIRTIDLMGVGDVAACAYCSVALVIQEQPPRGSAAEAVFIDPYDPESPLLDGYEFATVDHVIPRTKGGQDVIENVVLACWPCNQSKGNRLLGQWKGRP